MLNNLTSRPERRALTNATFLQLLLTEQRLCMDTTVLRRCPGIDTEGGERGEIPPLAEVSPPLISPQFFCGIATTLYYYAMFSAINVYTSVFAHSINMFPPLAKNPVSIPDALEVVGMLGPLPGHCKLPGESSNPRRVGQSAKGGGGGGGGGGGPYHHPSFYCRLQRLESCLHNMHLSASTAHLVPSIRNSSLFKWACPLPHYLSTKVVSPWLRSSRICIFFAV